MAQLYREETNLLEILGACGFLAIILSLIGAYSMASYMAERKSKQTSIRKVMGATVGDILKLSFIDFIKVLAFAFLIAAPAAYYISSEWLKGFTEKISIGPIPYVLSFLALSLLIFITVFYKEREAALANPIDNLRQE